MPEHARTPALEHVMTPFPHTIPADESITNAHSMMAKHGVRHLAVVHGEEVVGVVSARDLDVALALEISIDDDESPSETSVFAIASRPAYVVDEASSLEHVLEHMADQRIGCALITRRGKLAGILTTTDVCRLYAKALKQG
jgi:acetoin utilization protein AcuB